jgi:ATP-dependent RNA circularization protein (DNA/RNA ligase family)
MTNRKDGSWYDTNVYTEMADKYSIRSVLEDLLTDDYEFVTIQGETFGEGIQKRDYGLKEHVFEVFNVIFGYKDGTTKRLNPIEMKELMDKYNVPTVPIIATDIILPDTCEEVLDMAGGEAAIYGGMREGLVFRSTNGIHSFKAVDNEFLLKYHG